MHLSVLWLHFGNSVLDNSNWDKINHTLTNNVKSHNFEQSGTLFEMEKRIVNQILMSKLWYRSDIYYFKIYQRGN